MSAVFCWIVKYCWRQKTYCFFKKWHIYIHTRIYVYTFICAFISDNIKVFFNKYLKKKNADTCYVSLHSSGAMAVSQAALPVVTNTTHGLQWLHHLNIEAKQEATALTYVFTRHLNGESLTVLRSVDILSPMTIPLCHPSRFLLVLATPGVPEAVLLAQLVLWGHVPIRQNSLSLPARLTAVHKRTDF